MTADQGREAFLAEHGQKTLTALRQEGTRLQLEEALRVIGGNPFVPKLTFPVALGDADYHLTVERYDFVEDDDGARRPSASRFYWEAGRAFDDDNVGVDALTSAIGVYYTTPEEAFTAGVDAIRECVRRQCNPHEH